VDGVRAPDRRDVRLRRPRGGLSAKRLSDAARARRATAFGPAAEAYDRGRPGYPRDALAWCLPAGARRVLDLGAGTGKLTRGLLALGLDVVAVEPLAELRARVPSPATALDGSAEAIPAGDASVDAVLVGQAFHWFDAPRALTEIARVLRPGGTLGLLWNVLDDATPWVAALADASGAEDRASLARRNTGPPFSGRPGLGDPERRVLAHAQDLNADGLVANVASRSTTILMGAPERAALLARVRGLAPPGRFALPYLCDAWRSRRV
jgi:SAM-dependent methyltransferase